MKHFFLPLALAGALALTALGQAPKVELIPNPSALGSLQASWSAAPDGSPLLSWIETQKDESYTLKYAVRKGSQWSEPRIIAAHRQFFRQPAELPSREGRRGALRPYPSDRGLPLQRSVAHRDGSEDGREVGIPAGGRFRLGDRVAHAEHPR